MNRQNAECIKEYVEINGSQLKVTEKVTQVILANFFITLGPQPKQVKGPFNCYPLYSNRVKQLNGQHLKSSYLWS